ncbi:DUF4347 domain-containing protein, partial [Planctomycetota bacterium]
MKRFKHIKDRRSSSSTESKNSLPTFLEKLEPRILLSGDGLLSSAAPDPLIDMTSPVVLHAELLEISEPIEQQSLIDQDVSPSDMVETDFGEPILTLSIEDNKEAGDDEPEDEIALSVNGPGESTDDPVIDEIDLAQASIDIETTITEVVKIAVEEPIMTDPAVLTENGSKPTDLNDSNPDSEYASSIEIRGPPASTQATPGNQIVFVDSTLNSYFQPQNADQPGVVVEVLRAGSDAIQQISDILSNYQDVSAIHILSHGSPGRVQIGSVELNATSLDFYAERIQTWGDALTHDGDILLYGCSIAQGNSGLDVIGRIAEFSGADVAASDDPTGSADLGGDWMLESLIGPVEASVLGWEAVAGFQGLLAAGDLDLTFSGDGKLTTDFGSDDDRARSVAIQADGKIVVAGESDNGSNMDFALARYNADGSLDTSLSGDGKLTTDFGSYSDHAYSVAIQADGKIVVAGSSWNGSNWDIALARYDSDGSLD